MSERYSRLFFLSENLYAAGSPVVIAAGALLKDNQTGKVIAQLKLRSIHSKVIKAVTVSIAPLNTAGNPLGNEVRYEYLDLKIGRDKEFGQKTPIALPDASTRSFCVKVVEVVFDDNDLWNASEAPWEPLPTPSSIGTVHGAEFEKQFHLKYGSDSKNIPLLVKDLWFCSCGALNRQEEFCCYQDSGSGILVNGFFKFRKHRLPVDRRPDLVRKMGVQIGAERMIVRILLQQIF